MPLNNIQITKSSADSVARKEKKAQQDVTKVLNEILDFNFEVLRS